MPKPENDLKMTARQPVYLMLMYTFRQQKLFRLITVLYGRVCDVDPSQKANNFCTWKLIWVALVLSGSTLMRVSHPLCVRVTRYVSFYARLVIKIKNWFSHGTSTHVRCRQPESRKRVSGGYTLCVGRMAWGEKWRGERAKNPGGLTVFRVKSLVHVKYDTLNMVKI